MIAGDVRARNLLLGHLPVAVRDRTVVIDREFAAGSQELAAAAQSAISDQLATETGQHLDRWREMLSHDGPDIEPGEPRPASPPDPALADGIGATLRAPVSTVNAERG